MYLRILNVNVMIPFQSFRTLVFGCFFFSIQALFLVTAHAQEANLAAAGQAQNATGSSTWSVGQTAYLDTQGINGFQIQGVQQPYELQFLPGINDPEGTTDPLFTLYPNPVSDDCWLKVLAEEVKDFRFEIHNTQGILIRNIAVKNKKTPVSVGFLSSGTYIVSIWNSQTCLQRRKLIKR